MEGISYKEIAPRDVIGFHVFNPDSGRGYGKVVEMKRVRGEAHFVCESGGTTCNRSVEDMMTRLRERGYELCTEPWEVADPEAVEQGGVDEAEIKERARESWRRLADEYGLTESEVEDIIVG